MNSIINFFVSWTNDSFSEPIIVVVGFAIAISILVSKKVRNFFF